MRTSVGASTPRRTWLPRTSRTRMTTGSPMRIISPTFRVRMSMLALGSAARLGGQLDEELSRDLVQVGLVAPARHGVPQDLHLCGARRIGRRVVDAAEQPAGRLRDVRHLDASFGGR